MVAPAVDLFQLQDKLDFMLISGKIDFDVYTKTWSDLLCVAGYTEHQYAFEVDRRWMLFDHALN